MDINAVSLQDKIQKLIDQYTEDRQKLDQLEEQNNDLREENSQLMAQIATMNNSKDNSASRIQDLEKQLKTMESQYLELKQTIAGFESIASDAISRIDKLIPDLDAKKK